MKVYFFIISLSLFFACQNNSEVSTTKLTDFDKTIDSEIKLGQLLFFDPILSKDKSISCASCHNPEFAFADSVTLSIGVGGKLGTRNTPSVMNMLSRPAFFHDGRANSLQEQAIGPIENPLEMDLKFSEAVSRIKNSEHYKYYFNKIYTKSPDSTSILNALAAFQNSLESDGSAPHDLWMNDEDTSALSEVQKRGRQIFLNKGKCFDCHFGPDFTGDQYRNIGTYDGKHLIDEGRFVVTKDSNDLGKFKVPGLRNVSLTAPYMHNGMFKTLEEVIDYYNNPYLFIKQPVNMDSLMLEPLNLSDQEKDELLAFLQSLTDMNIPYRTKN